MTSIRFLIKHKWKILLFLYLLSITFSAFSIQDRTLELSSEQINPELPTVVYLADPGTSDSDLIKTLSGSYNIVLPEYELSPEDGIQLSFVSQADSIRYHIHKNDITDYHLIGSGVMGSVAMNLAAIDSNHVRSLALVSSFGVEEFELLGGYHLNHAVYSFKYGSLVLLKYLIPDFGVLKQIDEWIFTTRSQLNSDQRMIRKTISEIDQPVLIIHSQESGQLEGLSLEHSRLLPQSSYQSIQSIDQKYQTEIKSFFVTVDHGEAITRSKASPERIRASILPLDKENSIRATGKSLWMLMFFIFMATMVSEDLTCIGTGLLIAQGVIGFVPGTAACLIGIFVGDMAIYLGGRLLGRSALTKVPFKWFITEADIEKSHQWFQSKGPMIILASRFIPGSRFPTYLSAGIIGAGFWMFMVFFGLAALIWTPILVAISMKIGQQMVEYFTLYQEYALWVLMGVLFSLYIIFKVFIPLLTFKGRRLLVGKFMRITNWEFWPSYVIYFPVSFYIIWLWIRFRSITAFSAANPGIEDGGFIKESKSEILNAISSAENVARFKLVDAVENQLKLDAVKDFMESNDLDFPVVLKPDAGERGRGVLIPKNENELIVFLKKMGDSFIIQEFINGTEYGVFYYRYPDKEKGSVFSITRKEYLKLEGDGSHTIEELILIDKRAVCLAEVHMDKHAEHLYDIPADKEGIPLVELGTHARGALFFEANELITPELEKEIDRISKSFSGFYFGRYDIKVPDARHLMEGKDLKVIELNGVTSESTDIYDPKNSYFYAVKVLCRQWKIAYELGHQNRKRNPESGSGLFRLLSLLG